MAENPPPTPGTTPPPLPQIRDKIAENLLISVFVILGIFIVGALCFIIFGNSDCKDRFGQLKEILNLLLPLLGTWVGTVIAFYFGKENFEAANKSMQDSNKNMQDIVNKITSSDDKLKSIKVTDDKVMTMLKDISYNKEIATSQDKEILIKGNLIDFINNTNKGERLPIIDDKNICKYIIHKSTLTDFMFNFTSLKYKDVTEIKDKKLGELTLDDAINYSDDETKIRFTHGAAFIPKNATLFDAQQRINNDRYCQDVFVTETGKATEPIIGWITNNKIAELTKI